MYPNPIENHFAATAPGEILRLSSDVALAAIAAEDALIGRVLDNAVAA